MSRMALHILAALLITGFVDAVALAQYVPTTAPATRRAAATVAYNQFIVSVVLADVTGALTSEDVSAAAHTLFGRVANGTEIVNLRPQWPTNSGSIHLNVGVRYPESMTPEQRRNIEPIRAYVAERLRAIVIQGDAMPSAQRMARLKEANAQLEDLRQRQNALELLNQAQGNPLQQMTERVSQIRGELQGLEISRQAKEARRRALEVAISQQTKRAREDRDKDPLMDELQKLVKIREEKLARTKQMVTSGVAPTSELGSDEAGLAEAKIRLAEREAAMAKSGKGEVLDRLSEELTMVSVDSTELELRMGQLREELKKYDPSSMDAKALDNLLAGRPELRQPQEPRAAPLMSELAGRMEQLQRERFSLLVQDVMVTSLVVTDTGETVPAAQ